jgi:hypothetical protein
MFLFLFLLRGDQLDSPVCGRHRRRSTSRRLHAKFRGQSSQEFSPTCRYGDTAMLIAGAIAARDQHQRRKYDVLSKSRSRECRTARSNDISGGVVQQRQPGADGCLSLFVDHDIESDDNPSDVVTVWVKPPHFKSKVIIVLSQMIPNAHMRGQIHRICRGHSLGGAAELERSRPEPSRHL